MPKQRYLPKAIAGADKPAINEALFARSRPAMLDKKQRFRRYFPGVEQAANQAPIKSVQDPKQVTEPDGPAQETEDPAPNHDQELQEAFQKAAEEGFAAGIAQAQEQTQAKIDEHMRQIEAMLVQVQDMRQSYFAQYQEQCLEIALAGAEALARRAFREDIATLKPLIFEAVHELCDATTISLQVGTEHASELQSWVSERFVETKVQVVADPELGPEDFRASCKTSSVDGDFEARMQRLRHAIMAQRGQLSEQAPKEETS